MANAMRDGRRFDPSRILWEPTTGGALKELEAPGVRVTVESPAKAVCWRRLVKRSGKFSLDADNVKDMITASFSQEGKTLHLCRKA